MTRQTQLIEVIDAVDNLDTITALGSHIQEMAYHLDGSEGEFGAFLLVLEVFLKQLNETTKTIKENLSGVELGKTKITINP